MDSSDSSNELVSAVKENDASRVRSALQNGADPNTTFSWYIYKAGSVLCHASDEQYKDVIEALLESPTINVDFCGDHPDTPLYKAAYYNYPSIAKALLSCGANPDLPSCGENWTPLFQAAVKNNIEVAEVLLSSGASVDLASGDYDPIPLVSAAYNGHLEMCRLLLQYKANPNGTDATGATGIYRAACYGHQEVAQLLIDHGGDPTIESCNLTPAEAARYQGHTELADWLDQQKKPSE